MAYAGPVANALNAQLASPVVTASFAYDGDGLRADLSWDRAEGMPLVLTDSLNGAGATVSSFNSYVTGPGGLPLERVDQLDDVLYYHHDQLGSTRALTDKDGHVVQTYTYDPYGKATPSNTALLNPFQFAGQYVDANSGLIYMRARWYDPATGQFLSRDPIDPITRSPYGYVGGNPVNETDPTGLYWGQDVVRRAANDLWHPVRFVETLPVTVGGLGVAEVHKVRTGQGDCEWNAKNWVFICYSSASLPGADAFTLGSTVNTNLDKATFASRNCGRLLAHETKHTDQWAALDPLRFLTAYAVDTAQAEARATLGDGQVGNKKLLEQLAGLKDGGYESCDC